MKDTSILAFLKEFESVTFENREEQGEIKVELTKIINGERAIGQFVVTDEFITKVDKWYNFVIANQKQQFEKLQQQ